MEPGSWKDRDDFYLSVDRGVKDQLSCQQKVIDKLLSITLKYDNVLYNINNESSETIKWENYWAGYIRQAAVEAEKKVYITNMQHAAMNTVRHVMSYQNFFDYADISQNNQDSKGGRGSAH